MVIFLVSIQTVIATPNSINIQGKLTDENNAIQTGTFNFTFRIYDAYTSGTKLYEFNSTSTTDSRGIYDIILQDIDLPFNQQYYLAVKVNGDDEMEPRVNLTSVPYSFKANESEGLNTTDNVYVNDAVNLTAAGNVDASGTITAPNIAATSQLDVAGGFGLGGLTIDSSGDIITQGDVLFSGNISIVNVTHLSVNGSILPSIDDTFDLGNGSLRWRNLNLSGDLEVLGNIYGEMPNAFKLGNYSDEYSSTGFKIGNLSSLGTVNINTSGSINVSGNITFSQLLNCDTINTDANGVLTCGSDAGESGEVVNSTAWNRTGTNIILANNGDNVGIGTFSPAVKLVVIGNANISDSLNVTNTVQAGYFVGDGSLLENLPSSGGITSVWNSSGTNVYLNDSTAKVGIGTSSPTQKLTVVGNANITGNLSIGNGTFFYNQLNDRVGIGTTTPDSKLKVVGDINITGTVLSQGINITTPPGQIAAFNGSCPTGWTEVTATQGRTIVGTPSGGTAGGEVGAALSDKQDRTHNHTFDDTITHTHAAGTYDNAAEAAHTHAAGTYDNAAEAAHTHAVDPPDTGGSVTDPTHRHGIETDVAALGSGGSSREFIRDVTGETTDYSSTGISVSTDIGSFTSGTGASHDHAISGSSAAGASHDHAISGASASTGISTGSTANVSNTMPYIQLTWCRKDSGSDYAEWIESNEEIEDGMVVSADPENDNKVVSSKNAYDKTVLGIVSTKPGWLVGVESATTVKLALTGRVPVKVTTDNGIIERGDLLTTSSTPGYAMKFELLETNGDMSMQELSDTINQNEQRRNSILGKALEPCNEETCKIMVLITLQ